MRRRRDIICDHSSLPFSATQATQKTTTATQLTFFFKKQAPRVWVAFERNNPSLHHLTTYREDED